MCEVFLMIDAQWVLVLATWSRAEACLLAHGLLRAGENAYWTCPWLLK